MEQNEIGTAISNCRTGFMTWHISAVFSYNIIATAIK